MNMINIIVNSSWNIIDITRLIIKFIKSNNFIIIIIKKTIMN